MAMLESSSVMPKLITFLSSLLQRVAESNDIGCHRLQAQKISVFHGLTRPTISLQSYLERIFKYANCSPSCYIVAYVYLDRFMQRQPELPINSFNVHRLLITSVMISAKFMDDIYFNNAYYAKVGGISTEEMNFLEVDFLFGMGFHLNVTPATFHTYCCYLQQEMILQPQLSIISVAEEEEDQQPFWSSKLPHFVMLFNEDESPHQPQQQHQLAIND